jgi:hypothetical protein
MNNSNEIFEFRKLVKLRGSGGDSKFKIQNSKFKIQKAGCDFSREYLIFASGSRATPDPLAKRSLNSLSEKRFSFFDRLSP